MSVPPIFMVITLKLCCVSDGSGWCTIGWNSIVVDVWVVKIHYVGLFGCGVVSDRRL